MYAIARLLRLRRMSTAIGSSVVVACTTAAMAASGAEPSAATLFYDAHVFTAEYAHPYADAVAIRGDRIVAVGPLAAVERAAGPAARRVDLHGAFLMPGMIDAHVHPIMAGVTLIQANFTDQSGSIPALVREGNESRRFLGFTSRNSTKFSAVARSCDRYDEGQYKTYCLSP